VVCASIQTKTRFIFLHFFFCLVAYIFVVLLQVFDLFIEVRDLILKSFSFFSKIEEIFYRFLRRGQINKRFVVKKNVGPRADEVFSAFQRHEELRCENENPETRDRNAPRAGEQYNDTC
jgi:hypothetical protein